MIDLLTPAWLRFIGEPTTKQMPLTGAILSGKDSYKKILYYFTTTDISPEEINIEGERQLKLFYNQVRRYSAYKCLISCLEIAS